MMMRTMNVSPRNPDGGDQGEGRYGVGRKSIGEDKDQFTVGDSDEEGESQGR